MKNNTEHYSISDPKVIAAFLLILFNLIDLSLTFYAISLGAVEANPVMQFMIDRPWLVWVIKVAVVGAIGVKHIVYKPKKVHSKISRWVDRWGMWIAVTFMGLVVLWNTLVLFGLN